MKHFSVLLFAALIFVACGPKAPEGISIDPEVIKSTGWGGEYKVQVTCGGNWQASSNKKWVKLNPSEGKGNAEVTVTVAQDEDGEDAKATVTFSSGENIAELMVRRAALEAGLLDVNPLEIEAPAEGGEYTLTVTAYETSWAATTEVGWVTLSPESGEGADEITISVAKNNKPLVRTATIVVSEAGEEANEEHTFEVTVTQEAGEDLNLFSLGAGKKVVFSPGNLQYQPSTQTWRFAPNEWDCLGDDNENVYDTYEGWLDLFGWGTGNEPTKKSNKYADYETYVDWGVNSISEGNKNEWRCPTLEEWKYLMEDRPDADKLMGSATVEGVHGWVFLPHEIAADLFVPMAESWTTNTYTAAEWEDMVSEGAVFLPACGQRLIDAYGVGVPQWVGDYGYYWTSTPSDDSENFTAYRFGFSWKQISYSKQRPNNGYAVRLVRDK